MSIIVGPSRGSRGGWSDGDGKAGRDAARVGSLEGGRSVPSLCGNQIPNGDAAGIPAGGRGDGRDCGLAGTAEPPPEHGYQRACRKRRLRGPGSAARGASRFLTKPGRGRRAAAGPGSRFDADLGSAATPTLRFSAGARGKGIPKCGPGKLRVTFDRKGSRAAARRRSRCALTVLAPVVAKHPGRIILELRKKRTITHGFSRGAAHYRKVDGYGRPVLAGERDDPRLPRAEIRRDRLTIERACREEACDPGPRHRRDALEPGESRPAGAEHPATVSKPGWTWSGWSEGDEGSC